MFQTFILLVFLKWSVVSWLIYWLILGISFHTCRKLKACTLKDSELRIWYCQRLNHTHVHVDRYIQMISTNVGLAQACPNYILTTLESTIPFLYCVHLTNALYHLIAYRMGFHVISAIVMCVPLCFIIIMCDSFLDFDSKKIVSNLIIFLYGTHHASR